MATNSERIAANNTRLSKLVETAESLPDAGAGGGASVETCTVNVPNFVGYVTATLYADGIFTGAIDGVANAENGSCNISWENVVCGSCVTLIIGAYYNATVSGAEIIGDIELTGHRFITYKITAPAGGTVDIQPYYAD